MTLILSLISVSVSAQDGINKKALGKLDKVQNAETKALKDQNALKLASIDKRMQAAENFKTRDLRMLN